MRRSLCKRGYRLTMPQHLWYWEDTHQQQQLRDLGRDSAQGFLFGRPMTVEEIDVVLSSGILPGHHLAS